MDRYEDRRHAGRALAATLKKRGYTGGEKVVVLALPRGGVPVGFEVARELGAPLDVMVVRKLGVPLHEELAMGAIASGGVRVVDDGLVATLGIPTRHLEAAIAREERELERREQAYRRGRPPREVSGSTVIVVDDGLATGSTMRAAVAALRLRDPARIVVGVPVAAPDTCELLAAEADDVVCPSTPEPFLAVGLWYADFSQTTDDEVRGLLEAAGRTSDTSARAAPSAP